MFLVKAKLNNTKRPRRHGEIREFLQKNAKLSDKLRKDGWEKISSKVAEEGEDYISAPLFNFN